MYVLSWKDNCDVLLSDISRLQIMYIVTFSFPDEKCMCVHMCLCVCIKYLENIYSPELTTAISGG